VPLNVVLGTLFVLRSAISTPNFLYQYSAALSLLTVFKNSGL